MSDISHPRSARFLSEPDGEALLRIAREALEGHVGGRPPEFPELDSLPPLLQIPHGAFVTLRRDKQLRGCIGIVEHTHPLAHAVHHSAIRSAASDPRFPSVKSDEVSTIHIEVSALAHGDTPESPFVHIQEIESIVLGRDGLMIESPAGRQGLLLPQVSVERGWSVTEFLDALCMKAELGEGAWRQEGIRLSRFSAQVFSERS